MASLCTPPAEGPAVSIRDLAKSYGLVHAVRGITFDVERGHNQLERSNTGRLIDGYGHR